MSETFPPASEPNTTAPATQADLYDNLRRIGELEDKKHAIQLEIDDRTALLRSSLTVLDKGTLLHQMLSAALGTPAKKAAAKPAKKKTTRKKSTKKS